MFENISMTNVTAHISKIANVSKDYFYIMHSQRCKIDHTFEQIHLFSSKDIRGHSCCECYYYVCSQTYLNVMHSNFTSVLFWANILIQTISTFIHFSSLHCKQLMIRRATVDLQTMVYLQPLYTGCFILRMVANILIMFCSTHDDNQWLCMYINDCLRHYIMWPICHGCLSAKARGYSISTVSVCWDLHKRLAHTSTCIFLFIHDRAFNVPVWQCLLIIFPVRENVHTQLYSRCGYVKLIIPSQQEICMQSWLID